MKIGLTAKLAIVTALCLRMPTALAQVPPTPTTATAAPAPPAAPARPPIPGFKLSPWFGEQTADERTPEGINILINASGPSSFDANRPTLLVIYTTPNGNTANQTMGSAMAPGVDWHYDIQHVAAQIRTLRTVDTAENVVVACLEPDSKSWPLWRQRHLNNAWLIRNTVSQVVRRVPGNPVRVALAGHSGGGSFVFGYMNGQPSIPDYIDRIALLDADYDYDATEGHADKLKSWLNSVPSHTLVVLAYDDRDVNLNGRPINPPGGGTYRASQKMIDDLGKDKPFISSEEGPFQKYVGFNNRAVFMIHKNPVRKILHTALVGDMNGLLFSLTTGVAGEDTWGKFGGPRAFTKWIQPAEFVAGAPLPTVPAIPERGGPNVTAMATLAPVIGKTQSDLEKAVLAVTRVGSFPEFLKTFKTIHVSSVEPTGKVHTADYEVMPDYFAVGINTDFVRIPLSASTAQSIADMLDCTLPTRKMVDDIYAQAEVKLDPIALTQDRESLETFIQHNKMIELEREGKDIGLLVAGDKKDVVITNLLVDHPDRVAIYGWHLLNGRPIQPLTIIHSDSYVDYSHGVRLVRKIMMVDGKMTTVDAVLKDPVLCLLLSDEGIIERASYTPPPAPPAPTGTK